MTFREMRRSKQAVSHEECERILTHEHRGVLSMIGDDDYPYAVPVDFFFDPDDKCIYIHSSKVGHKIDALRTHDKVCFTTWNKGFQKEYDWAWNVTSVVAFGHAALVDNAELTAEKTRKLALKYYPTVAEVEKEMRGIARVQLIAIRIDHMTGKLVNEK